MIIAIEDIKSTQYKLQNAITSFNINFDEYIFLFCINFHTKFMSYFVTQKYILCLRLLLRCKGSKNEMTSVQIEWALTNKSRL